MANFILWIGSVVGIFGLGGDKALVRRKAEAKARRYAPFFKNVDESPSSAAPCLTGFEQNLATAWPRPRLFAKYRGKF
jgi:hypothetical protein